MVGQQVLWLWLRFSYRLCGTLPDRGHKFHSASTARPCEDPARSLPPPPVLMTPEPCHCCEKRHRSRWQEIHLRVYLTTNQKFVIQAVLRSAGSPHTMSSRAPCIFMVVTSAHKQTGLCNKLVSAAAQPYLPDGSSALSPGRMGKGRIHFHSCFTITAQHRC